MYIKNYIILLWLILCLSSCHEPEPGLYYQKYLDGNIRSFDIMNDTLFVASEDEGIFIYQINKDANGRSRWSKIM